MLLLSVSCVNRHSEEYEKLLALDSMYHRNKISDCIISGKIFVKEYPDNPGGWNILASAYLFDGNDSLATLMVDKALTITKKYPAAMVNKAIIYDNKCEYELAKEYYEQALKIDSNLAEAYSNFANNRIRAKDYRRAIVLGEKAVFLANRIGDKAILCLAYHKYGMTNKRDSLFQILKSSNYQYLSKLQGAFEN